MQTDFILTSSFNTSFHHKAEEQGKLDPRAPAYVNRRGFNHEEEADAVEEEDGNNPEGSKV